MHGYRFSMKGFEQQNWMTNIPLFAVKAFIEKKNSRRKYRSNLITVFFEATGTYGECEEALCQYCPPQQPSMLLSQ